MKIPHSEIKFHSLSFFDANGRLFRWNKQLYRGIESEYTSFCQNLFERRIVQQLVAQELLVKTQLTTLETDTYKVILQHQIIPFVSYPQEWCDWMLKDAALLHLNFCLELARHGLTTHDAHPLNILFHRGKPIFIDFCSIVPTESNSPWLVYEYFCRFFTNPLHLMASGNSRVARWLLHDYEQGVLKSDLEALTHRSHFRLKLGKGLVKLRQKLAAVTNPRLLYTNKIAQKQVMNSDSSPAFFEHLIREIEAIELPMQTNSLDYQNCLSQSLLPHNSCMNQHHNVRTILSQLQPNSLLDISNCQGWYSAIAARCGIEVVTFSTDEVLVRSLYSHARQHNLPILPLMMDLTSPAYGLHNRWFAPANERLQCDLVLALAVIHDLVFQQLLNFEFIIERLSLFSKRWLLVEFVSPEDRAIGEIWSNKFSWYTLDNFIKTLKQYFHSVGVMSTERKSRTLLLCEK